MTTLRIGGVPEHFNFPIHLAAERKEFQQAGLQLIWTDYPGGTGQMTSALRAGEVDMIIALTEGVIADIIRNNDHRIISQYVLSSLIWGIHTGNSNTLQWADEIFNKKHAISRWGSGSHLMAIVNAHRKGAMLAEDQFTIVQNLEGAIASLEKNETDVFYWEKYTTKPHVDTGRIRRIGEYVTPWPCFVIAASDAILSEQPTAVDAALDIINASCRSFMQLKSVIDLTSERYGIDREDAEKWYHKTEWATNSWVSEKMVESVIYHLKSAGIISQEQEIPEIIWKK